jgi:hypothetical protein
MLERVRQLMATGLLGREQKRRNPHSRMYTKNYADKRQRLTAFKVGRKFVAPKPSSPARKRAAQRARRRFFDRLKVGGAVRAERH